MTKRGHGQLKLLVFRKIPNHGRVRGDQIDGCCRVFEGGEPRDLDDQGNHLVRRGDGDHGVVRNDGPVEKAVNQRGFVGGQVPDDFGELGDDVVVEISQLGENGFLDGDRGAGFDLAGFLCSCRA
jgi:hypothetical protein